MIIIHDEIKEALARGGPVVALESAVITSGLPREPVKLSSRLKIDGWRAEEPVNLELARAMERTVRSAGAVPATIAVLDGDLHIGLSGEELEQLARDARAGKASITDLAHALTPALSRRERGKACAGTTVSATLAACRLTHGADTTGIRVLATGGIGGVHRDWQTNPDISADLRAIATRPVCVVCSGAKSILDLPATLEMLEALGVSVLGYRTHAFPQFQTLGSDDLQVRLKVDDAKHAAAVCRAHWETLRQQSGILLANPVPQEFSLEADEMAQAIEAAERAARERRVTGPQRTPFLLGEIARLTNNRSLEANLALLINNARLAAEVAIALR